MIKGFQESFHSNEVSIPNMKEKDIEKKDESPVTRLDTLKAKLEDIFGVSMPNDIKTNENISEINSLGEKESSSVKLEDETVVRLPNSNITDNSTKGEIDVPNIQEAHEEVVDGVKHYYDDNGNEYREGDNLKPNSTYKLNGYTYITDNYARIKSVFGYLHMKEHEGRRPISDSIEVIGKGDQKEGDDRGHLIGDQFDGTNGLENMIPQDANINRNDFRKLENDLAKEVRTGKEVFVEITPIYEGNSRRPSGIMVKYTIDGKTSMNVFPNGRE